jgi:hypothetical protein
MRTLLLALMIALLPIRGWIGDAMAVEMVRHSLPATAAASADGAAAEAHCHDAMGAMNDMSAMGADDAVGTNTAMDMPGHDNSPTAGSADHQGCGTCTACQVCHTVALGGLPLADTVHGVPQATPAARTARFASAEPAQGLKPPIS